MATPIRIKRRSSGSPGAPTSLANAELAFNEVDDTLYYGKGTGGAGGTATTVDAIGGKGAVVMLSGDQTVGGVKTFSSSPVAPTPTGGDNSTKVATTAFVQAALGEAGGGNMLASVYDPQEIEADAFDRGNHTGEQEISTVTGLQAALDGKADLASPNLTGTPTAPTAAGGTNTTQLATTAFVTAAIAALIGGAPGALDTLNEIAAALGDDEDFAASITTALAGKQGLDATLTALAGLATGSGVVPRFTGTDVVEAMTVSTFAKNFLDDADAAAVRSTLGLGSMAIQAAGSVAITGGTIDGVTIDCGTF